ncbi:MAG: hypothetical protein HRU33_15680 [Rhodobacteraceae bacterium]|nr:hypothetical protein [Paracoccaceae bacterium]
MKRFSVTLTRDVTESVTVDLFAKDEDDAEARALENIPDTGWETEQGTPDMRNMHLGSFHDVVGVSLGEYCLSILTKEGVEQLIRVKPRFNYKTAGFDPIHTTGEFGDFTNVKSGHRLEGIEPENIIEIDVVVNFTDDDFHTRLLSLKDSMGSSLTWELFCNGNI